MPIPLGILAVAGAGAGGGGAFDLLETTTVASSGSTVEITFSSIPSTYKHLQIRWVALEDSAGYSAFMRLNSDTGSNYSWHRLSGNGSAVTSAAGSSANLMYTGAVVSGGDSTAPLSGVTDILDYANTSKITTIRTISGLVGTPKEIGIYSGAWYNTNSVTSIALRFAGITLTAGSRFSLYGVK